MDPFERPRGLSAIDPPAALDARLRRAARWPRRSPLGLLEGWLYGAVTTRYALYVAERVAQFLFG